MRHFQDRVTPVQQALRKPLPGGHMCPRGCFTNGWTKEVIRPRQRDSGLTMKAIAAKSVGKLHLGDKRGGGVHGCVSKGRQRHWDLRHRQG